MQQHKTNANVTEGVALAAFPVPYPNEFLGGILLRFQARYGGRHLKATLRRQFDLGIGAVDGIPTAVEQFAQHLQTLWPAGAEEIVTGHTQWPFYRSFLGHEKANEVMRRIRFGGGDALQFALGDSRAGMPLKRCLRTCNECIEADRATYGEFYLHVEHQLPGVALCVNHEIPLIEWHHADYEVFPGIVDRESRRPATQLDNGEALIAHLGADIWKAMQPPVDPRRILIAYRDRLLAMGLLAQGGYVRHRMLIGVIQERFGAVVFKRLGITEEVLDGWIGRLIHDGKRNHHPLKHLLVIGALYGSAEAFFEALAQTDFQFNRPVMTVNRRRLDPAVEAALRSTAKSITETAAEVGLSVSTCIVYAKRLGVPVQSRPKHLTESKISAIATLARNGKSIGEIRRQSGSSVTTIYRVIRSDTKVEIARRHHLFSERRKQDRAKWERTHARHQHLSSTAVRKLIPAVYAWLYRYDRDWLKRHTRLMSTTKVGVCTVTTPRAPERKSSHLLST